MTCERCRGLGCWPDGLDDVVVCPDCNGYGRHLVEAVGPGMMLALYSLALEAKEAGAAVPVDGDILAALLERAAGRPAAVAA